MKTITLSEFDKDAPGYLAEVERGERILLLRYGKPIAQIIPYAHDEAAMKTPAWKRPGLRLRKPGVELSSAILEERESDP